MEVLTKSESEAITVVRMSPAAFEAAVAGTLRQQIPVRKDFRYPLFSTLNARSRGDMLSDFEFSEISS